VLDIAHGPDDVRLTALIVPSDPAAETAKAERAAASAVKAANALLAPHQRIADVRLWPSRDFPRTALGKVKRFAVRAALETAEAAVEAAEAGVADTDLDRLRRILGELGRIPLEKIGADSHLDLDLGLSSLGRVELAVALTDEFGIDVDDGDIAETETVAQLMDLVQRGQPRGVPLTFPDWALRAPARAARAVLQSALLLPVHALIARPFRVLGRENLAGVDEPVLFISNHSSHMDTVAIIRALPRRIRRRTTIAAAADYFYASPLGGIAASLFLNTFPFSRGGAVRVTLEHCGELVDGGWSMLVYPEGTRSTTGEMLPFKSGAGLLARELRVPIVPIAVKGGFEILPKGRNWPRPGPMTIQFGRPFTPPQDGDPDATARYLFDVVADLKRAVDKAHKADSGDVDD
jgi:long-chain acyl-CoA synthetase